MGNELIDVVLQEEETATVCTAQENIFLSHTCSCWEGWLLGKK